jgi:hypothetical protein
MNSDTAVDDGYLSLSAPAAPPHYFGCRVMPAPSVFLLRRAPLTLPRQAEMRMNLKPQGNSFGLIVPLTSARSHSRSPSLELMALSRGSSPSQSRSSLFSQISVALSIDSSEFSGESGKEGPASGHIPTVRCFQRRPETRILQAKCRPASGRFFLRNYA